MRITQHNGRTGSGGHVLGTAHNDRQFDISKADNIRNNGDNNFYLAWSGKSWVSDGSITFDEAERRYYENNLSEDLKRQNDRAIKARHKERVQTIDQYRESRKHCPEERILQIGNSETGTVPPEVFKNCAVEYINALMDMSQRRFMVLDIAIHNDEAVPHCHIRGVWTYRDEEGIRHTGQEKALEQIGIKPKCMRPGRENDNRYCNRKINFDSMMREKWLDICQEHGLQIEREPVPDGHHNMSKEETIREKYTDALEVIAAAEQIQETLRDNREIFLRLSEAERQVARDALERLADDLSR